MNERDLLHLLDLANRARMAGTAAEAATETLLDQRFGCDHRLVAYGTLRPGESNHDQLADVPGTWLAVTVPGRLACREYPVFTFDRRASQVAMQMLSSRHLPAHWQRLDAFEGAGYRRVLVPVFVRAQLAAVANLYAAATPV